MRCGALKGGLMPAILSDLTRVRGWLVEAVLAYLAAVEKHCAALPSYFPKRLRDASSGRSGFDALRQRVKVVDRPQLDRWQAENRSRAYDAGPDRRNGYAPRRAVPDKEARWWRERSEAAPATVTWDERTAERFPRAVILGDPGSGKTWLLRYEAIRLARAAATPLRDSRVGLDALVLPIFVRLPEVNQTDDPVEAVLVRLVCAGAKAAVSQRLADYVRERLHRGRMVVLLDAWDEVPVEEAPRGRPVAYLPRHRQRLGQRLSEFAGTFPDVQILMMSRDAGYRDSPIPEAHELELLALERADVEGFCRAWFGPSDPRSTKLLALLDEHPPLRELARLPLMVTLMCRVLEERAERFPTRRVELYHECLRGLLRDWKQDKGHDGPTVSDEYIEVMIEALARVAGMLFTEGREQFSASDMRDTVQRCLEQLPREVRHEDATTLIGGWKQDGILVPTGGQRGADLLFLHRTFHEYLTGVALVQQVWPLGQDQTREKAVKRMAAAILGPHVPHPAWREVILLAVGYLGIVKKQADLASAVIEELIRRAPGKPGEALALMGEAVAEIAPAVGRDARGLDNAVTDACREHVVKELQAGMRDARRVASVERAACGDALGRVGDPRFRADAWYLPDDAPLGFVEIPAGPFWMGSADGDREADEWERPRHQVTLPRYFIAKYPVTVAQFRAFVEDVQRREGRSPVTSRDCLRGLVNHPVVYVSWHEALAYCRWLTQRLREWPGTPEPLATLLRRGTDGRGWQVMLSSEAEWEKAARGGDRRIYPWSSSFDPNRVNCWADEATAIRSTSAVGCFPGGGSLYGVEELAGNVWEWTRSADRPYPYDADDGREGMGGNVSRVVRGGSFYYDRGDVRCAYGLMDLPGGRSRDRGFRVVVSPFALDLYL